MREARIEHFGFVDRTATGENLHAPQIERRCKRADCMTSFWVGCFVVFLLPVVTPRGKVFLWLTLAFGGCLITLWVQHIYVTSKPEYTGGVGSTLGAAVMICVTAAWILGLAVRYACWLVQLKREEILERREQKAHQRDG